MKINRNIAATAGAVSVLLAAQVWADGNRYNRDRQYYSEISASQAYQEIEDSQSSDWHYRSYEPAPVLIDVRSLEEYAAGHPEDGYNVPHPTICTGCDRQDDVRFYWEVYDIVDGDRDRLIMTLCRTGSRSITAANILADPQNTAGDPGRAVVPNGIPFTNVRNIWEGFVGQIKYAYNGGTIALDEDGQPYPLDLNNNGVIDADVADVYTQRKDANPDKDGWRNFLDLPWTTRIRWSRAYLQDPGQYGGLGLTPVTQ